MKSSIQKRIITISTITVVGLIGLITFISLYQLRKIDAISKSLVQKRNIIFNIQELTSRTNLYSAKAIQFSAKEKNKELENEILIQKNKITESIASLQTLHFDDVTKQILLDSFINQIKASAIFSDKIIEQKRNNILTKANEEFYSNSGRAKIDSARSTYHTLRTYEQQDEQVLESNNSKDIQVLKTIFYLSICAIFLTLIFVIRKIQLDLNYQKKVNEQLLYMATLINQTEDGIVSSKNDIIETWNKGAEKIYGYTAEEAIGKNVYAIVKTKLTEAEILNFLSEMEQHGKWNGEAVHTHKNGNKINLLISITKIEDKNSPNFFVSITKDITLMKKAEDNSATLSEILNSTNSAIFITSKDTTITTWNKGAEKLYGYSASEVIGKRSLDVLKVQKPLIDFVDFDYSIDQFIRNESIHFNKQGEPLLVDVSLNYKAENDNNGNFLIIISDITEKKKGEEQIKHLASIIQSSNDAIYTTNKEFIITSWNKGAERMYGYTEKEMLGQNEYKILPAFHPVFSDQNIKLFEEVGYFRTESSHRKKDGQIVIVSISVTYLKDENNSTTGFVIVINDVTEVKKLEGQLTNFNEKLEAEVAQKTKELNDVFGRVTDGFMALNNERCFTYVNNKAGEILQKNWKTLIGKNIEKEFANIDENFLKAYDKVIKTQQHIYFEDFFESFNSWLEFNFYPSSNGVSIYFKDITNQKKTQEDLIKLNYRFRTLASHLQNSREEERINIAREIHDELGQMATAIKIDVSWMKKKITGENEDVKIKMDETIAQLSEMVNTIRRIAQELRPSILDNLGLTAAIEWYCGDFQKRTNIQCKFDNEVGDLNLPDNIKTNLFRICQESLTNIMRHANATQAECTIQKQKRKIILTITDNGKGFDTMQKTKSLGLLGMQERAFLINAELKIESSKNHGTTIRVEIES